MNLTVMYRGPLTSCNYACSYCPFAKRVESKSRLRKDKDSLARFVDWIAAETEIRWKILFTPWGEALVRKWYQNSVQILTQLPHVEQVAAQTNLSWGTDWLDQCDPDKSAFWATFHPTETALDRFVEKVSEIDHRRMFVSVGMVAMTEQLPHIGAIRKCLPQHIQLWLNARQPRPRPYTAEELAFLVGIDPDFPATIKRHRSRGLPCRTGENVFTVDGDGNMRRCHFVDEVIGNIHTSNWVDALRSRLCPKAFCDCHLGTAWLGGNEPLLRSRLPGFAADMAGLMDRTE